MARMNTVDFLTPRDVPDNRHASRGLYNNGREHADSYLVNMVCIKLGTLLGVRI